MAAEQVKSTDKSKEEAAFRKALSNATVAERRALLEQKEVEKKKGMQSRQQAREKQLQERLAKKSHEKLLKEAYAKAAAEKKAEDIMKLRFVEAARLVKIRDEKMRAEAARAEVQHKKKFAQNAQRRFHSRHAPLRTLRTRVAIWQFLYDKGMRRQQNIQTIRAEQQKEPGTLVVSSDPKPTSFA